MKPKSLCPKCGEIFSRKWNMREHCRTQHHYDPDPNPRPSAIRQRKTIELMDSSVNTTGLSTESASVEKFLKMLANSVRFQQTGVEDDKRGDIAKSLGSIGYALDCLLDNFVIVSKREFNGISGFFCKECLSFQYRYITNIWDQVTVEFDHICNMTSDVDRSVKESELRIQANNVLIELTNSLFTGRKKFELRESYPDYQGPVIKFDSLAPGHWAWNAIMNTGVVVSDSYINDFITNVKGTYAQIIVENGHLSGTYLIAVQTIG